MPLQSPQCRDCLILPPGGKPLASIEVMKRARCWAALGLASILLSSCASTAGPAGSPEQTSAGTGASSSATAVEQQSPTSVPDVGQVSIPSALVREVAFKAEGRYVDNDGFEVAVNVTVYRAMRLTDDVNAELLCEPASPNAAQNVTIAGANSILQAAKISFASTNPRFLFPLQKYSEPELGRGLSDARFVRPGWWQAGGVLSSCGAANFQDGSANYAVVAALLAPTEATPDNPDKQIAECPPELELWVGDPLSMTMTASGAGSFRSSPDTEYGPSADGPGAAWWKFPVTVTPDLKKACLKIAE